MNSDEFPFRLVVTFIASIIHTFKGRQQKNEWKHRVVLTVQHKVELVLFKVKQTCKCTVSAVPVTACTCHYVLYSTDSSGGHMHIMRTTVNHTHLHILIFYVYSSVFACGFCCACTHSQQRCHSILPPPTLPLQQSDHIQKLVVKTKHIFPFALHKLQPALRQAGELWVMSKWKKMLHMDWNSWLLPLHLILTLKLSNFELWAFLEILNHKMLPTAFRNIWAIRGLDRSSSAFGKDWQMQRAEIQSSIEGKRAE